MSTASELVGRWQDEYSEESGALLVRGCLYLLRDLAQRVQPWAELSYDELMREGYQLLLVAASTTALEPEDTLADRLTLETNRLLLQFAGLEGGPVEQRIERQFQAYVPGDKIGRPLPVGAAVPAPNPGWLGRALARLEDAAHGVALPPAKPPAARPLRRRS